MRTDGVAQPSINTKKLRAIAGAIAVWIILSAIAIAGTTLMAIDLVAIGPRFVPSIITTWVLTPVATGPVTVLLLWSIAKSPDFSKKATFTRKEIVVYASIIGMIILALPLTSLVEREVKEYRNEHNAQAAQERFTIAFHLGNGPEFEEHALNQTLADLERSYQRLKDLWVLPEGAEKIYVELHRDIQSYHQSTGNLDAGGHLHCTERTPVIYIPLEEAPSSSGVDNSFRTPMHEMVHALMCQSSGPDAFYSIPRWFHEGMARRFQFEGLTRLKKRFDNRTTVWQERDELLNQETFCVRGPRGLSDSERANFYRTAHEFIRFIESGHDLRNLNLIVDDARNGNTFDESMRERLGGTCEELYTRWKESF